MCLVDRVFAMRGRHVAVKFVEDETVGTDNPIEFGVAPGRAL